MFLQVKMNLVGQHIDGNGGRNIDDSVRQTIDIKYIKMPLYSLQGGVWVIRSFCCFSF